MATLTSPATDIMEDIRKTNQLLSAALERKNAFEMSELYTLNAMLLPTGSEPVQGREHICNFWQGAINMGISKIELRTVEVELHSDTAIELGNYLLMDEKSQQMDKGKYIVVWKLADGHWKLHKDIWNTNLG
jgi:ketosteroid isomerase-like protein